MKRLDIIIYSIRILGVKIWNNLPGRIANCRHIVSWLSKNEEPDMLGRKGIYRRV